MFTSVAVTMFRTKLEIRKKGWSVSSPLKKSNMLSPAVTVIFAEDNDGNV